MIYYEGKVVSGQTLLILTEIGDNRLNIKFNKLFIKNIGDNFAKDISVKIYSSEKILEPSWMMKYHSPDTINFREIQSDEYKNLSEIPLNILNPQEVWYFPEASFSDIGIRINNKSLLDILQNTKLKIEVFYGQERPVEIKATLSIPKG